ncbi:MAG: hypothetical protein P8M30_13565 [Planctomycetaceae bacterium]|jgi:hypothetical protein|nr:hypothetical protein [Planctomycetaceae bacterium]
MCQGIALSQCEIPESLIERYELSERIIRRGEGDIEFRFLLAERLPVLPLWHEGQFLILSWGNRDRHNKLPVSAWCSQESLEAGAWHHLRPREVFIPASFAWDRGVWYQVREGLKGVVVTDCERKQHVYVLTQPATHYYEVMTRNNREPVMVGETI